MIRFRSSSTAGAARSWGRRSGAAAVELAVLLPFISTLGLGIIEMGRASWGMFIVEDAARAGCRAGTYLNVGKTYPTNGSITSVAKAVLTANSISTTNAQVDATTLTASSGTATSYSTDTGTDPLTAKPGDGVKVTVSVPWSDILWLTAFFLDNSGNAVKSVTMAKQ